MSHAQCTWLGRIPLPPAPSLLYPSYGRRLRVIRDGSHPRGDTGSLIAWKSLRRSRIFQWVDQWSKTTTYLKATEKPNATRKTLCRSSCQDCQPALPVPLQVRLQHRYRRTPRKTLRQVQRPYDVEVILFEEMSETKIKSKREVIQEAQKEQRTAWQMDKLQRKRDVILEAQREKRKVHFATLLDICDLKNAELEPNFQKYKGRVVLRGDIVKDGSGSYAVCTERGSSAWRLQK